MCWMRTLSEPMSETTGLMGVQLVRVTRSATRARRCIGPGYHMTAGSVRAVSGRAGEERFFTETDELKFSRPLQAFGRDGVGRDAAVHATGALGLALEFLRAGEVVLIDAGRVLDQDAVVGDVGDNGLGRGGDGATERENEGQQEGRGFHAGHGNKPRVGVRLHRPDLGPAGEFRTPRPRADRQTARR